MATRPAPPPGTRLGPTGWVVAIAGPLVLSGIMVAIRGEIRCDERRARARARRRSRRRPRGTARAASSPPSSPPVCFDFFFTRPYYSFTINSRDDVETTIVLLAVGADRRRARAADPPQPAAGRGEPPPGRIESGGSPRSARAAGPAGRLISSSSRRSSTCSAPRSARFERPPFKTALPSLGHGKVSYPATDPTVSASPSDRDNELELPVCGQGRGDRAARPRVHGRHDLHLHPARRPRAGGRARRPTRRGAAPPTSTTN